MKRWALCASLPLALLLTAAPGASAATCTAAASGAWTAPATWSCGAGAATPGAGDAVVIPAGKTVSVAEDETENAGTLTLRGTLALGAQAELDASGLAASGGTISGPQYAMLVVTVPTGSLATVESEGLTVNGAYLNVTGDGTFAIAGPLALSNGGWVESDIDATWTGSAPWQIGGAAGTPTSGFEMFGAQLTITGATAAERAGGGDGVIQLDGGSTLVKQDATTTDLDVTVLIDSAQLHVLAGKLRGQFQGAGSLSMAPGATLGLAGSGLQVAPPALDVAGAVLEVAADADISLVLPTAPAFHRIALGAGSGLDVSIDDGGSGALDEAPPADALGDEIAVGAGATLAIDSGGGTLSLAAGDVLSGSGTLDGSVENGAGTVAPGGALQITGDYTQGAGGTLALDLRSPGSFDSLHVEGSARLAGALKIATKYAPAAAAAPLVLAAASKPAGMFTKVTAPLPSARAWVPAYTPAGVALAVGAGGGGGPGAPVALARPSLQPAVPVVGGRTRCLPGKWKGAHALSYQWLRGGKPLASATHARYRVMPADRGHPLSCRVTATAAGGAHATATSKRAHARSGLRIGALSVAAGGTLSIALRCAASELRCSGSLRVLVAGHAVARGSFALHSPGGVVKLTHVGGAGRPADDRAAVVRAGYHNSRGAGRAVQRRLLLPR